MQWSWDQPLVRATMIVVGSLLVARLVEWVFARVAGRATKKTITEHDDQLIEILRQPIFLSLLLYGLNWATETLQPPARLGAPIGAMLRTLAILTWALAGARFGGLVLRSLAARERVGSVLQPRTEAIFDILLRFTVAAVAVYFMFLAWHIDLTAWLASAGILGIAFVFATRDYFSDTFAGVLILAHDLYDVHDWIVIDNKLRGEVIQIGLRTTRVLTVDDVEVLVRNGLIVNRKVTNESRGRHHRQRVRVPFEVAYGNEVEHVRALILAAVEGAAHVLEQPEDATAKVRLTRLGPRGLELELSVWITDPSTREPVVDDMIARIHTALRETEIEVPVTKHSVRVKRLSRS